MRRQSSVLWAPQFAFQSRKVGSRHALVLVAMPGAIRPRAVNVELVVLCWSRLERDPQVTFIGTCCQCASAAFRGATSSSVALGGRRSHALKYERESTVRPVGRHS